MKLTQKIGLFLLFIAMSSHSYPALFADRFSPRRPNTQANIKVSDTYPLKNLIQKKPHANATFFKEGFKASGGPIAKFQYVGVMAWLFAKQGFGGSPLTFKNPENTEEKLTFYGPMTKFAAAGTRFPPFLKILPKIDAAYGNMWEYQPSAKAALLKQIEEGKPLSLTTSKDVASITSIAKGLGKQDPEATAKLFKDVTIDSKEIRALTYLDHWDTKNSSKMNSETHILFRNVTSSLDFSQYRSPYFIDHEPYWIKCTNVTPK
jgi:hypothetical protein